MLARNETELYVTEHYGHCDRDRDGKNDCYWGKGSGGQWNGCLRVGWKGTQCPHWHPVEGVAREALVRSLTPI